MELGAKLDALLDKHDGAVGLTSYLDSVNGGAYKKKRAYVDAQFA